MYYIIFYIFENSPRIFYSLISGIGRTFGNVRTLEEHSKNIPNVLGVLEEFSLNNIRMF